MGEMNEVNGLLILAGMGIKKKGLGGLGGDFGAKRQKIPPTVKIKNSATLNKKYMLSKIEERSGAERGC